MNPAYVYDIKFPSQMSSGHKYPVIFALHGRGSNEKDMASLLKNAPDEFIVISVRGDSVLGQGYEYYTLVSLGVPNRESFDRTIEKLTSFIEYATEKYPIDPKGRYVLGFSQGAILATSLALVMGNRLKGIVAMNGYVPDFVKTEYALKSIEEVSIFISHGEMDSVFPIHIGKANMDYFRQKTLHLVFKTYPGGHEVTPENQQDVFRFLAHDWKQS